LTFFVELARTGLLVDELSQGFFQFRLLDDSISTFLEEFHDLFHQRILEGLRTFGHEPATEVVENGSQLMAVHFLGHFREVILE